MLGGGHVSGWLLDREGIEHVTREIGRLSDPSLAAEKYGVWQDVPLAIAVGDGNHSLATAKAVYEQVKAGLGKAALSHPARYALAELVNIHDEALIFEPIYRVVFNTDPATLICGFKEFCSGLDGGAPGQVFRVLAGGKEEIVTVRRPEHQLAVGTLQRFLDEYQKAHKEAEIDYYTARQRFYRSTQGRRQSGSFMREWQRMSFQDQSTTARPRAFSMGTPRKRDTM